MVAGRALKFELTRDYIGHDDQVLRILISSGPCLCCLNQAVDSFQKSSGQVAVKMTQGADLAFLDCDECLNISMAHSDEFDFAAIGLKIYDKVFAGHTVTSFYAEEQLLPVKIEA